MKKIQFINKITLAAACLLGVGVAVCALSLNESEINIAANAETPTKNVSWNNYDNPKLFSLWTETLGPQDATSKDFRITSSNGRGDTGIGALVVNSGENMEFTCTLEGGRGISQIEFSLYDSYSTSPISTPTGKIIKATPELFWWLPNPITVETITTPVINVIDSSPIQIQRLTITYFDKKCNADVTNYVGEYDGTKHVPSVTVTSPESDYTIKYSNDEGVTYTLDEPIGGTEVGVYTDYFKVTAPLYETYTGTATTTITGKPSATFTTEPTAKTALVANGQAQALVNAGASDTGTVVYRLGNSGDFSETIPTATDAGNYVVQSKILGDSTHGDSEPISINVTISEAPTPTPTPTPEPTPTPTPEPTPTPTPEPTPVDPSNNGGLPGWAIALIVVGGLLLACCGAIVLLFIFWPRYVVDSANKVIIRTILVFKKDEKVYLVSNKCKLVKAEKANVYKSKDEAKQALNK